MLLVIFLEATGTLHSFFKKMSAKYAGLRNHSFFSQVRSFPLKKKFFFNVLGSQLKQLHVWFSSRRLPTSGCSKSAICKLPISSHRILKRSVLQSQKLMKLLIFFFTISSRTLLSETGFCFSFFVLLHECLMLKYIMTTFECHWPGSCWDANFFVFYTISERKKA